MPLKPMINAKATLSIAVILAAATLAGCGKITLPGQTRLAYRFVKGESHAADTKTTVNLNFSKLVIPSPPSAEKDKNLQSSLIPEVIAKMIREGRVKSASMECRLKNDQMVAESYKKEEYADIYSRNELLDFRLHLNGLAVPTANIEAILRGLAGEGEIIKRDQSGGLRNLPKILGLTIPNADDPYLGRLLEYIRNAPSYPPEPLSVGKSWSRNLSILVPVDSLSDGQSKGFIKIEVVNTYTLEKVKKGIAHIKSDLSVSINWDVTVPEQGRTRFGLTLTGDGYRMFDIKKEWEYGMFVKGDVKLEIDAQAREKTGRKSVTQVQADGTFELASKAI